MIFDPKIVKEMKYFKRRSFKKTLDENIDALKKILSDYNKDYPRADDEIDDAAFYFLQKGCEISENIKKLSERLSKVEKIDQETSYKIIEEVYGSVNEFIKDERDFFDATTKYAKIKKEEGLILRIFSAFDIKYAQLGNKKLDKIEKEYEEWVKEYGESAIY